MTKNRECGTKQKHTKKSAEDHYWSLIRNGAAKNLMVIYKCRFCGHWHIGHRKNRKRGRKR